MGDPGSRSVERSKTFADVQTIKSFTSLSPVSTDDSVVNMSPLSQFNAAKSILHAEKMREVTKSMRANSVFDSSDVQAFRAEKDRHASAKGKNIIKDTRCYVCKKIFDIIKGILKHTCRVCGNAVCAECSAGKKGDQRMCDVCKEKAADPTLTEKRRAYIAEKEGVLRKRQIQLSEAKRKIKEVGETIITFDEKCKHDLQEQERTTASYEQELKKQESIFQKKTETFKRNQENVDQEKNEMHDRQKSFERLKFKSAQAKINIATKRMNLLTKIDQYNRVAAKLKQFQSPDHREHHHDSIAEEIEKDMYDEERDRVDSVVVDETEEKYTAPGQKHSLLTAEIKKGNALSMPNPGLMASQGKKSERTYSEYNNYHQRLGSALRHADEKLHTSDSFMIHQENNENTLSEIRKETGASVIRQHTSEQCCGTGETSKCVIF